MNNPNYPPQGGYRPPQPGYRPPQQGGYPPQGGYRPQQPGGYQQQGGYRPPQPVNYQQPVYQQNNFNSAPQGKNNYKGFSIAALVLGIVGVVGSFLSFFALITLACGVLGIVFGVLGQKKAKAIGAPTGLATAGFVCGIVGSAFSLTGAICFLACAGSAASIGSWL